MGKLLNLKGQKFGRLTILYRSPNKGHRTVWHCKCDCGNECDVNTEHLRSGHTQSCGCLKKDRISQANSYNLLNRKFGKLTVINKTEERRNKKIIWECQCDCGNITRVRSQDLLTGHIKSCGCILSRGEEKISQLLRDNNIIFETQKTFLNCKFPDSNYPAYFDFYLPDYNCIIEYDGIQHFQYRKNGWNTKENFLKTQEHDKYKNKYCYNNNLILIRIPYIHFNNLKIEDLLPTSSNFIFKEI